jgi:hypothetical protein
MFLLYPGDAINGPVDVWGYALLWTPIPDKYRAQYGTVWSFGTSGKN